MLARGGGGGGGKSSGNSNSVSQVGEGRGGNGDELSKTNDAKHIDQGMNLSCETHDDCKIRLYG